MLGWLIVISVLSLQQARNRGAATPAELADQATVAVRELDAGAFSELLADPVAGDGDFAQSYLDALTARGPSNISFADEAADRVTVQVGDGRSFPLRVEADGDRWLLSLLPPV